MLGMVVGALVGVLGGEGGMVMGEMGMVFSGLVEWVCAMVMVGSLFLSKSVASAGERRMGAYWNVGEMQMVFSRLVERVCATVMVGSLFLSR